MELTGVVVPVVTPFDESGRVDAVRLEAVIGFLIDAGVHSIVACGTTGEANALQLVAPGSTVQHSRHAMVIHPDDPFPEGFLL